MKLIEILLFAILSLKSASAGKRGQGLVIDTNFGPESPYHSHGIPSGLEGSDYPEGDFSRDFSLWEAEKLTRFDVIDNNRASSPRDIRHIPIDKEPIIPVKQDLSELTENDSVDSDRNNANNELYHDYDDYVEDDDYVDDPIYRVRQRHLGSHKGSRKVKSTDTGKKLRKAKRV